MGVEGQNFSFANPMTYTLLKEKADYNRRHMTDAERMVWEFLRPCLSGIRFRNQFIIGDYIVDFVALKQKIIIEIDGEYHFDKEQRDLDLEREEYLIKSGFKIIRFTNDTVLNHMEDVIREIKSGLH